MTDEPKLHALQSDAPKTDEPAVNQPLIGVAIIVVLAAIGAGYYWHRHHDAAPPPAALPTVVTPNVAVESPEERIEHPVPASKESLPALADSDGAFGNALIDAGGGASLVPYVVRDGLIRRIVVTVDNLGRQTVALDKRPITPAPGTFLADGDELHATLDPDNFARYQPLTRLIEKADMRRVTALYLTYYPLFQKAYQNLGYPNGYFNDRLVRVIDVLLATPQVAAPIDLVRPNVMYTFADPALESLPAGQKLLIRMGPDNAATLKHQLNELRAAITETPPPKIP